MSYILDALKKNEKERGVARIPTLMTVHDYEEKRHHGTWIAGGIILIGAAAAVWFLFPYMRTVLRSPVPAGPGAASGREAIPASDIAVKASAPASGIPVAAEIPSQAPSRDPSDVPVPGKSEASLAPSAGKRAQSRPGNEVSDRRAALPSEDRRKKAQAVLAARDESAVEGDKVEEEPPKEPPAKAEAQISGAAPAKAVSLREAVQSMKISILVYDEDSAERLVFINGSRYTEGDYVEGAYLLESITPQGALLSYGGERVLLKLR